MNGRSIRAHGRRAGRAASFPGVMPLLRRTVGLATRLARAFLETLAGRLQELAP
jgi:hypothetical protein